MVENSKEVKVVLYWANWCKFCIQFKPIWEELKEKIKLNKKLSELVKFEDYEETENKEFMTDLGINGFPTIHINGSPYNGDRTVDKLYNSIEEEFTQKGGEIQDNYFFKYLKYKTKYYQLKNNIK